jgi:prolyl-tRNA synthetase
LSVQPILATFDVFAELSIDIAMRLSQFHLNTYKESPSDAEVMSQKLMLRTGMIRKVSGGIYTWAPLGLRVLRKVEQIVREEMNRAGALEILMPAVAPKELWAETGRWDQFGAQLLKMTDRGGREFCFGPTHEEVVTDFARHELKSYKQLPKNFYQIQMKFRDEIRPRFGVMRGREFLMKDAYSFHLDEAGLLREYQNMFDTYTRIFTRLGLKFRAVQADTGAIGGSGSHEFHVMASSGEDALAYCESSDFAANVEMAEAVCLSERQAPTAAMEKVSTPKQTTCEDVAALLGIDISRTVKAIAVMPTSGQLSLVLVRGDHSVNEIKLAKLPGMADYRLATEAEIREVLGCVPGFIGPVASKMPIQVIADRTVAAMSDFVCGANEPKFHLQGVNFGRDCAEPNHIADVRNVIAGDLSPDGKGTLSIARGIEVGHVFQLGKKYAEAMNATVLDDQQKASVMFMGCYGIGVSRIVGAAIEQNFDERGMIWPEAIAPFHIAVLPMNAHSSERVKAAAEALYQELSNAGFEVLLDDRNARAGVMFADQELVGIPHRVVIGEKGLDAGTVEYRGRRDSESQHLPHGEFVAWLKAKREN